MKKNLYKKISIVIMGLCFSFSFLNVYAAAQKCADGVVQAIYVGYTPGHSKGPTPENTHSIAVKIDNDIWAANKTSNLNDPVGYALLELLQYSKAADTPIQIWDNQGTKCDDFDSVVLY